MAANEIIPVLKDISEQIDRLEVALKQLDAACPADGTAEAADLAAAHAASVQVAAKLTKAASVVLLLCRDIENARRDLKASGRYGKRD
jgi:hypothetical protein